MRLLADCCLICGRSYPRGAKPSPRKRTCGRDCRDRLLGAGRLCEAGRPWAAMQYLTAVAGLGRDRASQVAELAHLLALRAKCKATLSRRAERDNRPLTLEEFPCRDDLSDLLADLMTDPPRAEANGRPGTT